MNKLFTILTLIVIALLIPVSAAAGHPIVVVDSSTPAPHFVGDTVIIDTTVDNNFANYLRIDCFVGKTEVWSYLPKTATYTDNGNGTTTLFWSISLDPASAGSTCDATLVYWARATQVHQTSSSFKVEPASA